MERENVRVKVFAFIQELIDVAPEEITENSGLMEDLDISSLEIMTMIADLETEFKIKIDEKDTRNIVTVGDLIECVYNKLGEF